MNTVEVTPSDLIDLIRALDTGLSADSSTPNYLELRRWNREENDLDYAATALVRHLARQALGGFEAEAISAAVLDEIDAGPEVAP